MLTFLPQAKKVKLQAERAGSMDKLDIDFDPFADFDVCAASYTPIYRGSPSVSCPFDGAKHHEQFKGQLCRVCAVCELGAAASGLRLWVQGL
jgi:coatomer subunit alpha